jgi:hypothetical protein
MSNLNDIKDIVMDTGNCLDAISAEIKRLNEEKQRLEYCLSEVNDSIYKNIEQLQTSITVSSIMINNLAEKMMN